MKQSFQEPIQHVDAPGSTENYNDKITPPDVTFEPERTNGKFWRNFISILVIGAVTAAGYWYWSDQKMAQIIPATAQVSDSFIIQPSQVVIKLDITGTIKPAGMVVIAAPYDGVLGKVFTTSSQTITKGDVLAIMNDDELIIQHREAKTQFVKASLELETLKNWSNSPDMKRLRRRMETAKADLVSASNVMKETKTLFDQGIVSRNELTSAVERHKQALNNTSEVRDELEETTKKGNAAFQNLATLALKNAEAKMNSLEAKIASTKITAPISGVLTTPPAAQKDQSTTGQIYQGSSVLSGQSVFAIRKTNEFLVKGFVDEVDVNNLNVGQTVFIESDALAGQSFQGELIHIANEVSNIQFGEASKFEVSAKFKPPSDNSSIRLGMSARMSIITYQNDQAFVVPHDAIIQNDKGSFVQVLDKGQSDFHAVPVQTGHSLLNGIEITEGAKTGMEIVIPVTPVQ